MKHVLVLLAGILLLAGAAQADVVAHWDMHEYPGDQVSTPAVNDVANASGADMVRGPDLGASAAGNSMSSNGWSGSDAGDYFEFGFSVDAGYAVTLDELWLGTRSSKRNWDR